MFRYARPYSAVPTIVDGLPNFFHHANSPGEKLALLEAGINPIQRVPAPEGRRCPAILISSSPHKIGSAQTPWQDFFDVDNGHIRYFGDNKVFGRDPTEPKGNKSLLEQYELHSSIDAKRRALSVPILFFRRVSVQGRAKGNVQFAGFGIVSGAERITQYNRKEDQTFTNYAFDFTVFSLAEENEHFSWDWITARRNGSLSYEETLKLAPRSWAKWIKEGPSALENCRRRVSKLLTYTTTEQQPVKGSVEDKALREIYDFYSSVSKKHRFEALAVTIARAVMDPAGSSYKYGWITPTSSDGGADFIARLDLGTDFSKAKLIVLGQAKCEKLSVPTSGNHIARTVARLKRGWVGVYVTTSYFSEPVQREVIEDEYPIVLIHGLRLAQEAVRLSYEQGFKSVLHYIESIDSTYDSLVQARNPEEILFE